MKRISKANLDKPEREPSTKESVLMSFEIIVFYMEKHPTREPGFEFIPLYPAINQTQVWLAGDCNCHHQASSATNYL